MITILLSTTSYQDTPGPHHDLLAESGATIVRERGPLSEARMMELAGNFDALLCGDDAVSRAVLERSTPRLKVISKYGIGVDKIDVAACTEMGIPVSFCPGVNHTTVAEHTFALMLGVFRHLVEEANHTAMGRWTRLTGHEIMGKTMGIVGLGRIGREVAVRAEAFGLTLIGYDVYWPEEFARHHDIRRADDLTHLFRHADIISLHSSLNDETREMISARSLNDVKDGAVIVNCARGELVNSKDLAAALRSGKVGGYGADVLDQEPPAPDHPLLNAPNCTITPHIGSRTYESVERQAMMATENLLRMLHGERPLAQVNDVPIPTVSG